MCARYSLTKDELTILIGAIEVVIKLGARFNIAPTQRVPVIIPNDNNHAGAEAAVMYWGLNRTGIKGPIINAKAETLQTKPIFNDILHQRCLIPADGFYEWTTDKTPIRFTQPGEEPFCFAGLCDRAYYMQGDQQLAVGNFVILTTTPNPTVARIHDRMPLIVPPDRYQTWLAGPDSKAFEILNLKSEIVLDARAVSRELNNVKNEGPELLKISSQQGDLF